MTEYVVIKEGNSTYFSPLRWVVAALFSFHFPQYSVAITAAVRLLSSPFMRVYLSETLGSRCFCEQSVGGEALERPNEALPVPERLDARL